MHDNIDLLITLSYLGDGPAKLDKRGGMGISVMIIFIAMVLVAAVAAGVVLDTANNVRERAAQTGVDAIQEVSTGLDLLYVSGDVSNNKVTGLHLYMRLAAGSQPINSTDVVVSMTITGDRSTGTDNGIVPLGDPIIRDRAEFVGCGLSLSPGDAVNIRVFPLHGYSTLIKFTIPDVLTPGTVMLR